MPGRGSSLTWPGNPLHASRTLYTGYMNACSDRTLAPFVEVAPDTRLADRRTTLTYRVPAMLDAEIEVGQLIWVPLRQKLVLGVVVERHNRDMGFDAREIHAPVEPTF